MQNPQQSHPIDQILDPENGVLITTSDYRTVALSLRVDNSSSIFSWNLDDAIVQAVHLTERTLALCDDNLITRGLFDAELKDLDIEFKERNKRILFRHPDDEVYPNFSRAYKRGWGTHLDVAVHKDLDRLLRRWRDPRRRPRQRQIALLMTDGKFSPGGNVGGPDRIDEIKPLMDQLLEIADNFGGPENSPVAFMYVGFGRDRHEHIQLATGRYGLPECWVLGRQATVQDIQDAGQEISRSLSQMNDGMKSCFGWGDDDNDRPNHEQTQFGFGNDDE